MLFLWVLVVVLGFVALRLNTRLDSLEDRLRDHALESDELAREVARLAQRARESDARGVPVAGPATAARPAAVQVPADVPAAVRLPTEHGPAAKPALPLAPVPSEAQALSAPAMQAVPATPVAPAAAVTPRLATVAAPTAPPPPLPQTVASAARHDVSAEPPSEALPAEPSSAGFDWENLVGVKLFSAVAGVALVVAAILFLRFSIQQGWLQPPIRVAVGVITAVGLLAFSERKAAGRYRVTADALDAAAVTMLYATFFAAHARWHLVGTAPTFALLVAVTVLAILLAVRRASPLIAGLGLLGGFAAPALLSSGEDHPFILFGYLAVLNGGLSWVARHKRWAPLVGASLVVTTAYQWGWVMAFLTPETVPAAVGIFSVFPALAFLLLWRAGMTGSPPDDERSWHKPFRTIAAASAMAPLLVMPVLAGPPNGVRFEWLFAFLGLLAIGYLVVAVLLRLEEMHLLGAVASVVVTLLWLGVSYSSEAWPGILAIVWLFAGWYLAAPLLAARAGAPLAGEGRHGVLAAPVLLLSFAVLALKEPAAASPTTLFTVMFALAVLVAAFCAVRGTLSGYLALAAAVLAAEVCWSIRHLDSTRSVPALAVYLSFSLLFLAVPLLARRSARPLSTSVTYLGLAGFPFLMRLAGDPSLGVPPPILLAALAVLAVAAGLVTFVLRRPDVQLVAVAAVAMTLLVWESAGSGTPWPTVALAAALAMVAGGSAWAWWAHRSGMTGLAVEGVALVAILGAQIAAIVSTLVPGVPALPLLLGTHVVLLVAVLTLSWRARWHAIAPLAVFVLAVATQIWFRSGHTGADWRSVLEFAALPYVVFVAYPLLLGRRVGRELSPYLTAVLANVPFFVAAHWALDTGGFGGMLGLLPLTQALVMAVLLAMLLRIEPVGFRTQGRLALVAAAVLAGVTAAVPVQFDRQWLTLGWALEAAALAWLFTRIPHRGLLWWCAGLLSAVFVRLALNPDVLVYAARSATPIFNWYLYTYGTSSVAFLATFALLQSRDDTLVRGDGGIGAWTIRVSPLAAAGAVVLLFLLVNIEVADYYSTGETIEFGFGSTLAQDLTYTLAWGLYAVILLGVGIRLRSRAARAAALALLVVTVFKCFLYDLARLEGLYRVASFVGLAVCLALVAVALQKYVLAGKKALS